MIKIIFLVIALLTGLLSLLGLYLTLLIAVLISIAITTLNERKIMGSIQRRHGPDVVGFLGTLQPIADGLKLFIKEMFIPQKANLPLFLFAPFLVLLLSLYLWIFLPIAPQFSVVGNFSLSLLYLLVVGVMEIYGIVFAGWASNSKYALLGGLRSTAQMISYELSLSFIFISLVICTGSLNLIDFFWFQYEYTFWYIVPLLPFALIFLVSMLAETNRAPFDLPEAEAEIVAGYNVEYSGILFALFFLGEYSNMLFLSAVFVLLFLGGNIVLILAISTLTLACVFYALKTTLLFSFFVWVRATLPRYRYDQLMELGWKVFLPVTFALLIALISLMYLTGSWALPRNFGYIY